MLREQGTASTAAENARKHCRVRWPPDKGTHQIGHVLAAERGEVNGHRVGHPFSSGEPLADWVVRGQLVQSRRDNDHDVLAAGVAAEIGEQVQRRRVGPVQVLHDEGEASALGAYCGAELLYRGEQPIARARGRRADICTDWGELGDENPDLLQDIRGDPGGRPGQGIGVRGLSQKTQQVGHRPERQGLRERKACAVQHHAGMRRERASRLGYQPRLADARVSYHDDQRSRGVTGEGRDQSRQLIVAPDKSRSAHAPRERTPDIAVKMRASILASHSALHVDPIANHSLRVVDHRGMDGLGRRSAVPLTPVDRAGVSGDYWSV